jgi:hypothetical protein
MFVGAVATIWCRPDLKAKTWIGGVIFLACYSVLLQGLRFLSPGYIERVWRLDALLPHPCCPHAGRRVAVCLRLRNVLVGRLRAFHMAPCRARHGHEHAYALTRNTDS